MAIGDVLSLAVVASDSSETNLVVTTYHFRQASSLVLDFPWDDLAGRYVSDALPLYQGLFGANLAVRVVQVRTLVAPITGADFTVTTGTGTRTGSDYLPRQVACVVSWRTAFLGRPYRGRVYLPPMLEADQNDGFLTVGYQDDAAEYAQSLLDMNSATIGSAAWELVVHSDTHGFDTPVTSFQVRSLLGGQNRRRQGRGA